MDLHEFLGIYPAEKRKGIQRILLSPLNPTRSVLTGIPPVHPDRGWALEAWLLSEKIKSLEKGNLLEKMRTFCEQDPSYLSYMGYNTPYRQIASDIIFDYPVNYVGEGAILPSFIVGPD